MKKEFGELTIYAGAHQIKPDKAISIYHKFDFTNPACEYTAAFPIKKEQTAPSNTYYTGSIPVTKAIRVTFIGDYNHIGNAWAAAFSYLRYKKLKQNKKIDPFEIYITDPKKEPDPSKWITEIYIPIK